MADLDNLGFDPLQHSGEDSAPSEFSTSLRTEPAADPQPGRSLLSVGSSGIVHLLFRYPLLFWVAIWTLLLLAAGLAVTGLMDPNLSSRQTGAPAPQTLSVPPPADPVPMEPQASAPIAPAEVAVAAPAAPTRHATSPLILFGAVAGSCASLCFFLSHRLLEGQSHIGSQEAESAGAEFLGNHPLAEARSATAAALPALEPVPLPSQPLSGARLTLPAAESGLGAIAPFAPASLQTRRSRTVAHLSPVSTSEAEAPGLAELQHIQQRRTQQG